MKYVMEGKDGALDLIAREVLNSTCIYTRADTHVLLRFLHIGF